MKGFAFTSFALLASGVVLSAALFASSGGSDVERTAEAQRISSASFFLESFVSDSERSLQIATRRALTSATNFIVQNGIALSNPSENISQIAINGTLEDEEVLGEAHVKEWESRSARLAEDSSYRLNVSARLRNLSSNFLEIRANYTVETRLFDPVTLSRFRSTDNKTVTVSAEGLEDPLLLLRSSGRYVSSYTRCDFVDPAEMLRTGTQNSSSVFHGDAVVSPSDPASISNPEQKVLIVEDVDDYSSQHSQSSVTDFGAVVSAQESENPSTYSEHYVFGTGSSQSDGGDESEDDDDNDGGDESEDDDDNDGGDESVDDDDNDDAFSLNIGENESITVYREQVWRTNFREMFQQRCYIEDVSGPGVLDRFENNADALGGVATLLDVSALPTELQRQRSAVGHEYFDSDQSKLRKIHGVTEYYPWFRLDQSHIQQYNVQELVY